MRYKPNYAPGPTEVRENVRLARAKRTNNSDFDKTFVRYSFFICQLLHLLVTLVCHPSKKRLKKFMQFNVNFVPYRHLQ